MKIMLFNSLRRVNRFVKRLECNEQMSLSIIKLVDGKPSFFFSFALSLTILTKKT